MGSRDSKSSPARRRECHPLFVVSVAAGFPSPADDYVDGALDLNDLLIAHPAATFFVRVSGDSMVAAGIHSGDMLVVDRAVRPTHGRIVVAVLDGGFTVKRIERRGKRWLLRAENPEFALLEVSEESELTVWGVVTYVIHSVR